MEWGDVTPLRTKTIRLLEGDLFVTVVNAHGLQTDNATSYCMEMLRPTGMALATMQAHMEAVCQFQNWCGARGIDFIERLVTGEFFQQHEVAALRETLRKNLRKPVTPPRVPGGRRRHRQDPHLQSGLRSVGPSRRRRPVVCAGRQGGLAAVALDRAPGQDAYPNAGRTGRAGMTLADPDTSESEAAKIQEKLKTLSLITDKTLVVIDEASMVDLPTVHSVTKRLVAGSRLLLVGDEAQLPPIGFGLVFHKLVKDPSSRCS